MVSLFKKIFNISCLLGFHDNVSMASMTHGELEYLVRTQMKEGGMNTWIINTMPWPSSTTKIVHSKVCACCGKFTNDIQKYAFKRSKLYYKLEEKHTIAVGMYMEKYADVLHKTQEALKEVKKDKSWDLDK